MILNRATARAQRSLLPEGRLAGPMPWVIAIMMFLMVLAAASGMALSGAVGTLGADLAGRLTIQILDADPARQTMIARKAMMALHQRPDISTAKRVDADEMQQLLRPWLGDGLAKSEILLPVMIDVTLKPEARPQIAAIAADLRRAIPAATIDDQGQWLAPLSSLMGSLRWLAAALVLLVTIAATSTVVLAARAALNTHAATIDVMHLLGATDGQIARLFQRRIALDTLFGATIGWMTAGLVILLIGQRVARVGSDLLGTVGLEPWSWAVLMGLPFGSTLLAMLVARWTVIRALKRLL